MTSQDDLALLKGMHQRGEITDAQYDVLRRHVLWGTPLPQPMDDVPAPRTAADPPNGYVPGAATVGPDRYPDAGDAGYASGGYAGEPGGGRYPVGGAEPVDPPARRYASRRERREAEEAGQAPPTYLPPAPPAGPGRSRHRRADPTDSAPPTPPTPENTTNPTPHRHRHRPTPPRPDPAPTTADRPAGRRPAPGDPPPATATRPAAGRWPGSDRIDPPVTTGRPGRRGRLDPDDVTVAPVTADWRGGRPWPDPGRTDGPGRGRLDPDDVAVPPVTADWRGGRRRPDAGPADGPPGLVDRAAGRGRPGAADGEVLPATADRPGGRRWSGVDAPPATADAPRRRPEPDAGEAPTGRTEDGRGSGSGGRRGEEGARRRPHRRSVFAVLTSVVLALALAAGGVYWFVLRTKGLPPATYARETCGVVRDWQQSVDSSNAKLVNQIARQQNKATIRSDVTAYYTTIAGRTDQLRTAVLGLGAADITGGREYADALAAAVGDQATGLRRLADRAGRLDPATAAFATDLQTVLTGADSAVSAVASALARPPAGITTELRTTLSNEPACAPYVG